MCARGWGPLPGCSWKKGALSLVSSLRCSGLTFIACQIPAQTFTHSLSFLDRTVSKDKMEKLLDQDKDREVIYLLPSKTKQI